MEELANKLIRNFYLGDLSAWEQEADLHTNEMLRWLNFHFKTLNEIHREDILPNFQAKFFEGVRAGHRAAEVEIDQAEQPLTVQETEAIKIRHCTTNAKFDLSHGTSFRVWMKTCLRHAGFNLLKRQNQFIDPGEDESTLEQIQVSDETSEDMWAEDQIREILRPVLNESERIYLELWFSKIDPPKPPNPSNPEVIAVIYAVTGRTISPATASNLKRSFLVKSYLELLERCELLTSLASLFQRLTEMAQIENLVYDIMIDNIWKTFFEDPKAVQVSHQISKEQWTRRENMKLRRGVEEVILVEAYRHFRLLSPLRPFCRKIEFYANNRFGGRIRQLFMKRSGE